MRHGLSCREALTLADVPISERTAYRALKVVRTQGEEGLADGRHGHPYKLTTPVREWLVEYCRGAPGTPSRVVQAEIGKRFRVAVSISQINRTRRALGISSGGPGENRPREEQDSVEGAGYVLLLAAAHQTGLIDARHHRTRRPVGPAMVFVTRYIQGGQRGDSSARCLVRRG